MPEPEDDFVAYLADFFVYFILIVAFVLQIFTGLVDTQTFIAAAAFLAASWARSAKWSES